MRKTRKEKMAGVMAQVVQQLPSKYKAMSSNSSTTKTKQKKYLKHKIIHKVAYFYSTLSNN
jgi:hypothetical protein